MTKTRTALLLLPTPLSSYNTAPLKVALGITV